MRLITKKSIKEREEDELLKKEDEGGALASGEVSAPSSDSALDTDINSSSTGIGISTNDIFGKCDHKKDGFFGPGCFHRPLPLFTKPISRIPKNKKKRKYIKVLDLTESEDFAQFKNISESIISSTLKDINDELKMIDNRLEAVYNTDYIFDDYKEDWVAALDKSQRNDDESYQYKIVFGINLPVIYNYLDEQGVIEDKEELKCQLDASIYHEIAHGLIAYFEDEEIYDFELTNAQEEKICEEYANYKMRKYTNQDNSKLQEFIDEIFGRGK